MAIERQPVWRSLAVAVLAVSGFALSTILLLEALGSVKVPGCGVGGGCEAVQATRWAWLLGIPVSAWAIAVYLGVGAGLIWERLADKPAMPQAVVTCGAVAAGGAAVWFVGVQWWIVGQWCVWCTVTHAVGVLLALVVLSGKLVRQRAGLVAISVGVVSVVGLAALQTLMPWEPATTRYAGEIDQGEGSERVVTILGLAEGLPDKERRLGIRPAQRPHIGDLNAPVAVIELIDYTCAACRQTATRISEAAARSPQPPIIVVLPAPLSHHCNPHLTTTPARHETACHLARLAIAVAVARPEAFAEMHTLLISPPSEAPPVTVDQAESTARELLGTDDLTSALNNPQVDDTLDIGIDALRRSTFSFAKGNLPQVFIGHQHLMGTPSVETLTDFIRESNLRE